MLLQGVGLDVADFGIFSLEELLSSNPMAHQDSVCERVKVEVASCGPYESVVHIERV